MIRDVGILIKLSLLLIGRWFLSPKGHEVFLNLELKLQYFDVRRILWNSLEFPKAL